MKSPLAAFCLLSPRRVLVKRRENSSFTAEKEDEMTIFYVFTSLDIRSSIKQDQIYNWQSRT